MRKFSITGPELGIIGLSFLLLLLSFTAEQTVVALCNDPMLRIVHRTGVSGNVGLLLIPLEFVGCVGIGGVLAICLLFLMVLQSRRIRSWAKALVIGSLLLFSVIMGLWVATPTLCW
jgi:hypothetical protein